MRRWKICFLVLLMVACLSNIALASPEISAESAILYVADSKKVLFQKNPDTIMYPASTTKILTALTILKYGNLNDIVTIDRFVAETEPSGAGLQEGDKISVKELLYALMLPSGNDAAVALAEYAGKGNSDAFIAMMNNEAKLCGAVSSHFMTANGLPDKIAHFSTVRDIAKITFVAFAYPFFNEIIDTQKHELLFINRKGEEIENTNRLLGSFKGADGVKTGTTSDAGNCLVASATCNGVRLLAVVFNCEDRYKDAKELLDYGFSIYENQ